jgi:hypothetical protein
MRTIAALLLLSAVTYPALAQQSVGSDQLGSWEPRTSASCDTIYGEGRQLCLADRYHMQRDQQARDEQSALRQAQAENQRLNSELLRRELAPRGGAGGVSTVADVQAWPDFAAWHVENRWFGTDRARTEYAVLYAKDLHREQPELAGRAFLNALSARVREVFAPAKR